MNRFEVLLAFLVTSLLGISLNKIEAEPHTHRPPKGKTSKISKLWLCVYTYIVTISLRGAMMDPWGPG
jgi:hypothetical protein